MREPHESTRQVRRSAYFEPTKDLDALVGKATLGSQRMRVLQRHASSVPLYCENEYFCCSNANTDTPSAVLTTGGCVTSSNVNWEPPEKDSYLRPKK